MAWKKVFVFGIDGAMPEKVFGDWREELPNINKLMKGGCYGKVNSTVPPVSVVAWTSIVTGKKPTEHGIFECFYRREGGYELDLASSYNVKEKRIWEIAAENGKKAIACFIPLAWPVKPYEGILTSGFFTPLGDDVRFTHPVDLQDELDNALGRKVTTDVKDFRSLSKEEALKQIYDISDMHFDIMKHLIKEKEWDFFLGVINGSDRANHRFWRYQDEKHRNYEPSSEFYNSLKDYYKYLDKRLGELMELLDDETLVMVISDHGITRMHNRVNFSDWLIKEGYLVLKEGLEINEPCKLESGMIDWGKTRVFATGAYDGQVFVNLKGRDALGVVEQGDYGALMEELEEKIKRIKGDDGKDLDTYVYKKGVDLRGKNEGIAPDLVVYFDNLEYGCNSTRIGNPTLWSPQTAAGSDDAAHSRQGIFVMGQSESGGDIGEVEIFDIPSTILKKLGIEIPSDFVGKAID